MKKLQSLKHLVSKRWKEMMERKEYKAIITQSKPAQQQQKIISEEEEEETIHNHERRKVPAHGFAAVYVGKEATRFVIPLNYLNHPAFKLLLEMAEEEFGLKQEGGLMIPCDVIQFERLLWWMKHPYISFTFRAEYADEVRLQRACIQFD